MSQTSGTLPVLKECPSCSNEVKDIAINNLEVLEMCTNTKCIYPFSKADTMSIKCLDNNKEIATTPTDTVDIQQFLDELTSTNTQEVTKDVSDIISELMNSSPMFQDTG